MTETNGQQVNVEIRDQAFPDLPDDENRFELKMDIQDNGETVPVTVTVQGPANRPGAMLVALAQAGSAATIRELAHALIVHIDGEAGK